MVNVLLTNETHVDVIAGGSDDNENLIDLDNVPKLIEIRNNLPARDIENHHKFEGIEPRHNKKKQSSDNLVDKPNKTVQESGWTPLQVIDSLPKVEKTSVQNKWKHL